MSHLYLDLRINSTIQIMEYKEALRTSNALEIMNKYPCSDKFDHGFSFYLFMYLLIFLGQ